MCCSRWPCYDFKITKNTNRTFIKYAWIVNNKAILIVNFNKKETELIMIEEYSSYYGISVIIFLYLWLRHPSDDHHPLILILNPHFWKWWIPFNLVWYLISEDLAVLPITIFGSILCMAIAKIIYVIMRVSKDDDN